MKYFGEPQCPYCGKRVNLIRTWSLKRQGEYCCTHCGGYSNVHHLPILYILALVCALVAICDYVFERYIFQTVSLKTVWHVFLPFVVFFIGSLFFIQLKKPTVKTGERESLAAKLDEKKRRLKKKNPLAALFGAKPEPAQATQHTRVMPAQGGQNRAYTQQTRAVQRTQPQNTQQMPISRR